MSDQAKPNRYVETLRDAAVYVICDGNLRPAVSYEDRAEAVRNYLDLRARSTQPDTVRLEERAADSRQPGDWVRLVPHLERNCPSFGCIDCVCGHGFQFYDDAEFPARCHDCPVCSAEAPFMARARDQAVAARQVMRAEAKYRQAVQDLGEALAEAYACEPSIQLDFTKWCEQVGLPEGVDAMQALMASHEHWRAATNRYLAAASQLGGEREVQATQAEHA